MCGKFMCWHVYLHLCGGQIMQSGRFFCCSRSCLLRQCLPHKPSLFQLSYWLQGGHNASWASSWLQRMWVQMNVTVRQVLYSQGHSSISTASYTALWTHSNRNPSWPQKKHDWPQKPLPNTWDSILPSLLYMSIIICSVIIFAGSISQTMSE